MAACNSRCTIKIVGFTVYTLAVDTIFFFHSLLLLLFCVLEFGIKKIFHIICNTVRSYQKRLI
ncbi:hypothetical protein CW304_20710 [Bacillus sp. UFRGS-B20]|nr:hypothetical protein CW304_20710 [Bacillus sp. UFRGS-B20]